MFLRNYIGVLSLKIFIIFSLSIGYGEQLLNASVVGIDSRSMIDDIPDGANGFFYSDFRAIRGKGPQFLVLADKIFLNLAMDKSFFMDSGKAVKFSKPSELDRLFIAWKGVLTSKPSLLLGAVGDVRRFLMADTVQKKDLQSLFSSASRRKNGFFASSQRMQALMKKRMLWMANNTSHFKLSERGVEEGSEAKAIFRAGWLKTIPHHLAVGFSVSGAAKGKIQHLILSFLQAQSSAQTESSESIISAGELSSVLSYITTLTAAALVRSEKEVDFHIAIHTKSSTHAKKLAKIISRLYKDFKSILRAGLIFSGLMPTSNELVRITAKRMHVMISGGLRILRPKALLDLKALTGLK